MTAIPSRHPNIQQSDFLFACVQSSNDAIMLTSPDGLIFYVNPAWEKIYGYSQNEAIGNTPRLLRSGHHPLNFYSKMWADILDSEKGYWKGEVINATKSGTEVQVLLTISPCLNEEGVLLGYMSISVDITDKKKMESQLQWQDRLATLGTLTSGLAHELGTPLGIIRGRAELLMNNREASPSDLSSLKVIVDQTDRVTEMMISLQNLSHLTPTEVRLPVTLQKAAKDVENILRAKLGSLSIQLEVDIPSNAQALAEPGRLEYILLNLCMNSLHAIEEFKFSGKQREHFIRILAKEENSNWIVAVSDSGGGINVDDVPHLFKPFFTTKDVGKGTGLGLAMIHQIVHSWKGALELDNKPGLGATFRIHLPKP